MATRKSCRHCGHHWFWHLNDGRYKCRQCGQRQNFRSVWETSRLPDASKRRLLEYFVLGVPANRLRFRGPASPEATSRFYLSIRQVLALLEDCSHPFNIVNAAYGLQNGGENGTVRRRSVPPAILLGIQQHEGRLKIQQLDEAQQLEFFSLNELDKTYGQLVYSPRGAIYASLAVRGKKVTVTAPSDKGKARESNGGVEGFWGYTRNWLYSRRAVSEKFFHLYLAETLFRYNHRDEDLYPLIYKALRETDSQQIQTEEVRIEGL